MEQRRWFIIIGLLALASRLPLVSVNDDLLYDEALYLSVARNLSKNICDYTMNFNYMTYRPPFLPYFLSLLFRLGLTEVWARFLLVLFSVSTILVTYHFVQKHFGRKTAILTSLLLVSSPLFLKYGLRILAHEPFALFYTTSVFLFHEGSKENKKLYAAGAMAALAYLSRYVGLMFFGFVFFYFLFENLKSPHSLFLFPLKNIHVLGLMFVFLLLIAPWSYFNYVVYGDPLKYAKVASTVISRDKTATFSTFLFTTLVEVTPWVMLFFILGIGVFLKYKNIFMLSWLASSFLFLLSVPHKESRYLTDFFPLIAMTASVGLESLFRGISKKGFWLCMTAIFLLTYSVGLLDVYRTRDYGAPLVDVGDYLSKNTPEGFSIVAWEEAQVFYYTKRRVYPFPEGREEFEKMLSQKRILFVVENEQRRPDYLKETLADWHIVFWFKGYKIYGRGFNGRAVCLFG